MHYLPLPGRESAWERHIGLVAALHKLLELLSNGGRGLVVSGYTSYVSLFNNSTPVDECACVC